MFTDVCCNIVNLFANCLVLFIERSALLDGCNCAICHCKKGKRVDFYYLKFLSLYKVDRKVSTAVSIKF